MEQFLEAVTDQYSKCTISRKTQHTVILFQYAYQLGYQCRISTMSVLIKFILENKSLNIHFYVWKKSSKEMKVDSRTHFAGDLLIRDTTFSWSLQSVSRETHCPFEVAKGPDVSATPGLTSWTFWVIGMIWITSVSLKTNFRNFEGFGINGSNTDQLNDPFLRKTGPDRSI